MKIVLLSLVALQVHAALLLHAQKDVSVQTHKASKGMVFGEGHDASKCRHGDNSVDEDCCAGSSTSKSPGYCADGFVHKEGAKCGQTDPWCQENGCTFQQCFQAEAVKTTQVKPTKTVKHDKVPGNGYKPGSPLYEKQEERHANQTMYGGYDNAEDMAKAAAENEYPSLSEKLAGSFVYAVGVLLFACLYKQCMVMPLQARVKGEAPSDHPAFMRCGFAHSCCDCSNLEDDWPICLWSACCPIIQWAGTASKSATPFLDFWPAVLIMLLLVILSPFTWGFTGLAAVMLMLVRRRKLRQVYNHNYPETKGWFEDFCFVCCCDGFTCCRLVQEAREVEYTSPKLADSPVKPQVPSSGLIGTSPVATSQTLQPGQQPAHYTTINYAGGQASYSNVAGQRL